MIGWVISLEIVELKNYVDSIQKEMDEKEYDDYVDSIESYKVVLEESYNKNPDDITVVCQLACAYFELCADYMISINLIKDFYERNKDRLTNSEKVRLYTNLAYYYDCDGEDELCQALIQDALALNPNIPQPYYASAIHYLNLKDYKTALTYFEKAYKLEDSFNYAYDYAIALYKNDMPEQAKVLLQELRVKYPNNNIVDYGYACCCLLTGDIASAVEIRNKLYGLPPETGDVDVSQLADLFFAEGLFKKHNFMNDTSEYDYYYDIGWLDKYFYGLLADGKTDVLEETYQEAIASKDELIKETQTQPQSEDWTLEDIHKYVNRLQKEKDEIAEIYKQVTQDGFKPKTELDPFFLADCFLVDCIRHQVV